MKSGSIPLTLVSLLLLPVLSFAEVDGFQFLRIACRGCEMREIPSAGMLREAIGAGLNSNHLAFLEKEKGIVLLVEQAAISEKWAPPPIDDLNAFSAMRVPLKGMVAARSLAAMKSLKDLEDGNVRTGLRRLRNLNRLGIRLLEDRLSFEFAYHCLARVGELAVQQKLLDALPELWLHPSLKHLLSDLEQVPPIDICWEGERVLQQNTLKQLYQRVREELDADEFEKELIRLLRSKEGGDRLAELVQKEGLCTMARWERETRATFREQAERDIAEIRAAKPGELRALGEQIQIRNGAGAKNLPSAGTLLETLRELASRDGLTAGQLQEFHDRAGEILTLGMSAARLSNWCSAAKRWYELIALERISVLECAARIYPLKERRALEQTEELIASGLVPREVAVDPFSDEGELLRFSRDEQGRVRFRSARQ